MAVGGLFGVSLRSVLEPVDKQLLVLLQHQELAQHHRCLVKTERQVFLSNGEPDRRGTRLVKAFLGESLTENLTDAGQVGDVLVTHRLRHKIAMLLRRRRHGARAVKRSAIEGMFHSITGK